MRDVKKKKEMLYYIYMYIYIYMTLGCKIMREVREGVMQGNKYKR